MAATTLNPFLNKHFLVLQKKNKRDTFCDFGIWHVIFQPKWTRIIETVVFWFYFEAKKVNDLNTKVHI